MNLAVLERMIGQGDLSREAFTYLLTCRGECEWLDYKESLHLEHDAPLCGFARDVLAFKNVGGGYLVVGIRDKSWEQAGMGERFPYDTKQLRDKVVHATGVTLDVDVVQYVLSDGGTIRHFALILVRSSKKRRKRRNPTLAAKDFCGTQSYGIRRGDIYVRSGDSTIKVTTQQEIGELLDRLEDQADNDKLQADAGPSPFAVEEGTYRLLERGFENFVGRQSLRERLLDVVRGDPRIWITNVHGPGGVGKSALVNWATYELYRTREFEAILQLTAKETVLTDAGIMRFSRSLYSLENLLDQVLLLFDEPIDGDTPSKRSNALELLDAWKTLLVLDNMETVSDARVLAFVQDIPPGSKSRVVLTSRQRSGGWELALPVTELTPSEMLEFVRLKSTELGVAFPTDPGVMSRVMEYSGGLPLAAQWIIGQFKKTGRLDAALDGMTRKDSPVLEFSFRNIWATLSAEARTVLSLMSIFDGPTTTHELAVAGEIPADIVEHALGELIAVTLVNRNTHPKDGSTTYSALPITMSFARNELGAMGELEVRARRRMQQFNEQMELQAGEIARFGGEFQRYALTSPNEKRAAILCRRAESEMFSGNADTAELLFEQACELAPHCAYVHAKYASYELARNRVGKALERVAEACKRATGATGALSFVVKARILDVQRNRSGRVEALAKALTFDPGDTIVRHQYGVALSRYGMEDEAIQQFTTIIDTEVKRGPPTATLMMALTTRAMNLGRRMRLEEARRDIAFARDLIARYPRLASASDRLDEIDGNLGS